MGNMGFLRQAPSIIIDQGLIFFSASRCSTGCSFFTEPASNPAETGLEGLNKDCPAHTPRRNIQRRIQKQTMAMPPIPLRDNSNLILGRRRFCTAICYIFSGAVSPIIFRPLPTTILKAAIMQSRAWLRTMSSDMTLCLL